MHAIPTTGLEKLFFSIEVILVLLRNSKLLKQALDLSRQGSSSRGSSVGFTLLQLDLCRGYSEDTLLSGFILLLL